MATFTFITFEATDSFASRTVAIRSEDISKRSRLDAFRRARGWEIVAIHQVESPNLPAAFEWLRECITVWRNPETPQELLA